MFRRTILLPPSGLESSQTRNQKSKQQTKLNNKFLPSARSVNTDDDDIFQAPNIQTEQGTRDFTKHWTSQWETDFHTHTHTYMCVCVCSY
jgi:hypothetical protein